MVTLIGLPAFLSPLYALLMALFGAVALSGSRRKSYRIEPADDVEQRIDAFTRTVRRRAKIQSWFR
jgi:hypothetical protein